MEGTSPCYRPTTPSLKNFIYLRNIPNLSFNPFPVRLIFHPEEQQFVAGTELGAHVTQSLELMQPTATTTPSPPY